MDCLFCKIVAREIPADMVFENDACLAFRDLNPQAPTHVLIVPKKHIDGLASASLDDDLQSLLLAASEIARQEGIDRAGYRVVINSGQQAGQTVFHLHVHVLGGRTMAWPPG
ncbi:MAG: histidine triad nucleotide-binding protein [Armatimonadetes bacterium]|nr:histidine triad nucleotide-binding protein [Armatimonadota bacterium]